MKTFVANKGSLVDKLQLGIRNDELGINFAACLSIPNS